MYMISLAEEIKIIESRNKMFKKARKGEKPICPKCHKGHIICDGNLFFYCNNTACNVKITLEPSRT